MGIVGRSVGIERLEPMGERGEVVCTKPSRAASRLVVAFRIIFMAMAVMGGWRAAIIAAESLMG